MSLQIAYTVHSCHQTQTAVQAQFNGQPVTALVPHIVLELVADDGSVSHIIRHTPAGDQALQQVLADFAQGRKVTATFNPA